MASQRRLQGLYYLIAVLIPMFCKGFVRNTCVRHCFAAELPQISPTSHRFFLRKDATTSVVEEQKFANDLKVSDSMTDASETNERLKNGKGESQKQQLVQHHDETVDINRSQLISLDDDQLLVASSTLQFLYKSTLVGLCTGISVVIFKTFLQDTRILFYETLADVLPKPAFYWPLALYPIMGSIIVCALTYANGMNIRNGIDFIAKSIDSLDANTNPIEGVVRGGEGEGEGEEGEQRRKEEASKVWHENVENVENVGNVGNVAGIEGKAGQEMSIISTPSPPLPLTNDVAEAIPRFDPKNEVVRLLAAVATLGSGCSLGPEGPAVEIGASFSRIFGTGNTSAREKHHLFLAGTAAGVAAGFNAPIAGVFFALECGNRYLAKNTIKLDEQAPDGPRADIAAIVCAGAVADIIVELGLHETNALAVQGNLYAMASPIFELSLYAGLGIISGVIAVAFTQLRDFFTEAFEGKTWGKSSPLTSIPPHLRPLVGGISCGLTALYFPQTIFVGYATLDQMLAGGILGVPLVLKLLFLKMTLSAISLGSGLIGGVFAPSLFFGAAAGTAYQNLMVQIVSQLNLYVYNIASHSDFLLSHPNALQFITSFFSIASAPAYATVGAAATLGALFRAPLTSSMLMFELTQNHEIVLPVLVSTGLGGLFADLISPKKAKPRKNW